MRQKFREFLVTHDRGAFRTSFIFTAVFTAAIVCHNAREPVQDFLNGTCSSLDGYCVGPVMSGTK